MFTNKTVIITGASSGLGKSLALDFAKKGARLALFARHEERLRETEKVCREYMAKDPRVRYYRNESNIGAARNFNHLVELARGVYFKWLAADCVIAPTFLERCLGVLEQKSDLVLVTTQFLGRSEFEKKVIPVENDFEFEDDRPYRRFQQLLKCEFAGKRPIWGLMRADLLQQTSLIRSFVGSDDCLLIELVLQGNFGLVPERLATVRRHSTSYTDMKIRNQGVEGARESKWLNPNNNKRFYLPHWKRLWEYFLLARGSKDTFWGKLRMTLFLLWPVGCSWSKILLKEGMFAFGLRRLYLWLKYMKRRVIRTVARS